MKELFICYNTLALKEKGVPYMDNVWLTENYTPKGEPEGLAYKWVGYNSFKDGFPPINIELKFPQELFLIVQKEKEIHFDYLAYRKSIFFVSEDFLFFLKNQGIESHFEIASLKIVHRNGLELSVKKKYYAIRVGKFDDDLFDFIEDGKKRAAGLHGEFLYPSIKLKNENVERKLFFLNSFCYTETIVVTEEIKIEMLEKFYSPEIYTAREFALVFNNRTKKELLPSKQKLSA